MPIYPEFETVIVQLDAINLRYTGGMEAFRANCPNATLQEADGLVAVSFMASRYAEDFLDALRGQGLEYNESTRMSNDFTVFGYPGFWWPAPWIVEEDGGFVSI